MGVVDKMRNMFNGSGLDFVDYKMPNKGKLVGVVRDEYGKSCRIEAVVGENKDIQLEFSGNPEVCDRGKDWADKHYNLKRD